MTQNLAVQHARLSSSLSAAGTTINLDSAITWSYPKIVIGIEVITITAGNGTSTLTVTRGSEGTSSPTGGYASGSPVRGYYLPDVEAITDDGVHYYFGNRRFTTCEVSQACPGGPEEFTFEFICRPPYNTVVPPPGTPIYLKDNIDTFWIGRVEDPTITPVPSGRGASKVKIVARGFASHADARTYRSTLTFAAGLSLESVMKTVRDDLCPLISSDNSLISSSGRTLIATSPDFDGQSAQKVWNTIAGFGTNTHAPLLWFVDGNGASTPKLRIRERGDGASPDYFVTLAALQDSPFTWPLQKVKNEIYVRGAKDLRAIAFDVTSQGAQPGGYREIRTEFVDASGIDGWDQLYNIGLTHLAILKNARPTTDSLVVEYQSVINDTMDAAVDLWRIPAGTIINVSDFDTDQALMPTTSMFLRRVSFDFIAKRFNGETEDVNKFTDIVDTSVKSKPALKFPPLPLFKASEELVIGIPIYFDSGAIGTPLVAERTGFAPVMFACRVTGADMIALPADGGTITVRIDQSTLTDWPTVNGTIFDGLIGTPNNSGETLDTFYQLNVGDVLWWTVTEVIDDVERGCINLRVLRDSGVQQGPHPSGWVGFTPKELSGVAPTAPAITSIDGSDVDSSSVTITWDTTTASDSRVDFGFDTDYGSAGYNGAKVTSHSITLSGLPADTDFVFKVGSQDSDGQLTEDDNSGVGFPFTTLP